MASIILRSAISFARMFFFRPLSFLNVNVYPVPLDDIARFIAQGIGSNKKPAIDSIEAAMSRFRLSTCTCCQAQLPLLHKARAVVGMNRISPAPSQCLLRGHPGVVKPTLIQEIDRAIRLSRPSGCWNCIDGRAQCLFARTNRIFRLLSIFNINVCSIPFHDCAEFITQRVCTKEKPSINSVESAISCFRLRSLQGMRPGRYCHKRTNCRGRRDESRFPNPIPPPVLRSSPRSLASANSETRNNRRSELPKPG